MASPADQRSDIGLPDSTLEETRAIQAALAPPSRPHSFTVDEMVESLGIVLRNRQWKYRYLANSVIAVARRVGGYDVLFAKLRAFGVQQTDLQNAKQLVFVFEDYVSSGPASLEWYDGLNYMTAVLVNRATHKHGRLVIRKEQIFDNSPEAISRLRILAAG